MAAKQKHSCESCGSIGLESSLAPFRGKLLCGACMVRWLDLDRRLQRQSSFEEMIAEKKFWNKKEVSLTRHSGGAYTLRMPYSMWIRSSDNDK